MNRLLFALVFLQGFAAFAAPSDIVYIGDSHSAGCFGTTLDSAFRKMQDPISEKPLSVRTLAVCHSSTESWLPGGKNETTCGQLDCQPTDRSSDCRPYFKAGDKVVHHFENLDSLLQKSGPPPRPKVTVVELGTNILLGISKDRNATAKAMDKVKMLIGEIGKTGSRCIWIGPPQADSQIFTIKNYNEFTTQLKKTVESQNCKFIDSGDKTDRANLSASGGWIHYACPSATLWANKVIEEIKPLIDDDLRSPSTSRIKDLIH
jgi:hypothetical protein